MFEVEDQCIKKYLVKNDYSTVFDLEEEQIKLAFFYSESNLTESNSTVSLQVQCYLEIDERFADQINQRDPRCLLDFIDLYEE